MGETRRAHTCDWAHFVGRELKRHHDSRGGQQPREGREQPLDDPQDGRARRGQAVLQLCEPRQRLLGSHEPQVGAAAQTVQLRPARG
jgi:hypothetical protein